MKIREEEELEKFIRENKDKFDTYHPEPGHNQLFLSRLIKKFKAVINIVPYLVKVGIATIFIFILSFIIWKTYLSPPLTNISLKYWKAEHNYKFRIRQSTSLARKNIIDPEEKAKLNSELQQFEETYEILKKKLKENPSEENIADMLRFYKEKLLAIEENIQNNRNKATPDN